MVINVGSRRMTSQRFITGVKYNTGLSDSLFVPQTLNYDKMKK